MAKIQAIVSQGVAKIGVRIAYRLRYDRDIRHAIVTANTWEEIAEFVEGDECIVNYNTLWDMSGELS